MYSFPWHMLVKKEMGVLQPNLVHVSERSFLLPTPSIVLLAPGAVDTDIKPPTPFRSRFVPCRCNVTTFTTSQLAIFRRLNVVYRVMLWQLIASQQARFVSQKLAGASVLYLKAITPQSRLGHWPKQTVATTLTVRRKCVCIVT